ncbi:hypothetical protein BH747_09645 [Enterococcus villorum]|uniref:Uncharacterized protein n=1 Tax=Enterococcus villorum TaxID=112904 RepID=A0A1V8YB32_9ENTE|nr:hypothetical protein [Enterococcus villorum]OQO69526.1 hypothetical protein BH747_09645 [Enterococcus villorum]OQO73703.1 hypothetical protein BH744_09165 [Enterococcus villorum]
MKDFCILCEKYTELTKEHVPPRKSGNNGNKKTRTGSFEDFLKGDFSKGDFPKGIKRKPQGNIYYTLCSKCNSFFGSEYVEEYIKFVEDNKNFLEKNTSLKNEKPYLTHSIKKINPLRVAKAIVAMFFSINGERDSFDKQFLDSVRGYLNDPQNRLFPNEDYTIIMNYYLPIGVPQNDRIKIPNDIINDGHTHNIIKGFMTLNMSNGETIRFSEIQYESIGFTLIDLKNTTFKVNEGFDLKNLLCIYDKTKKIHLYKVPILTPTMLTMMEMQNNINYIDSGSDLLIRWQVITNFLKELKKYNNVQTNFS